MGMKPEVTKLKRSQSLDQITKLKPKLWLFESTKLKPKPKLKLFKNTKLKPKPKPRFFPVIINTPFYHWLLAIYWNSVKYTGKHDLKMKNVEIFKFWDNKTKHEILDLWSYKAKAEAFVNSWSWSRSFEFLKPWSWSQSQSFVLKCFGFVKPKPKPKQLRTHGCQLGSTVGKNISEKMPSMGNYTFEMLSPTFAWLFTSQPQKNIPFCC